MTAILLNVAKNVHLPEPSTTTKKAVSISKKVDEIISTSDYIGSINAEIAEIDTGIFINNNTIIDLQGYSLTTITSEHEL